MNTRAIREAESVTRSIARWGSGIAAVVFGIAFLVDDTLSWEIISGQAWQIAMVVAIFLGYALAWTERFEITGSAVALAAMFGVCLYTLLNTHAWPDLFFLAVGAPAFFHLVAVGLHRYTRQPQAATDTTELPLTTNVTEA